MVGRYIVDLDGYGINFMNHIRNYSLGYRTDDLAGQSERERYIYNDSANQIFMILDANLPLVWQQLNTLPNMNYFQHIPDIHDPIRKQAFIEQFRIFSIGLINQVQKKIGLFHEFDYLLEVINDSYMIVNLQKKVEMKIHEEL